MDAPHDLTISSAPLRITGSGERMLAVYVAETRDTGSRLHKLILLHRGARCPPLWPHHTLLTLLRGAMLPCFLQHAIAQSLRV